jgi:uncharacterized RDD family membrane protein YckC
LTTPPEFPTEQPVATPTPLAEWVDRVVATLIDIAIVFAGWVVVFVITAIIGAISDTLGSLVFIVGYIALTAFYFYVGYMEGEVGQSPGKRLTGLKVVKMDGQLLGGGMGIVRRLAHIVDGFCFIGYLFPLWDPKKQTLADKIMGTVVLKDQEKQSFGPDIFRIRPVAPPTP